MLHMAMLTIPLELRDEDQKVSCEMLMQTPGHKRKQICPQLSRSIVSIAPARVSVYVCV